MAFREHAQADADGDNAGRRIRFVSNLQGLHCTAKLFRQQKTCGLSKAGKKNSHFFSTKTGSNSATLR